MSRTFRFSRILVRRRKQRDRVFARQLAHGQPNGFRGRAWTHGAPRQGGHVGAATRPAGNYQYCGIYEQLDTSGLSFVKFRVP
jgi:hypothetical protein